MGATSILDCKATAPLECNKSAIYIYIYIYHLTRIESKHLTRVLRSSFLRVQRRIIIHHNKLTNLITYCPSKSLYKPTFTIDISTETNGFATGASTGSSSNKRSQNDDEGPARMRTDNQPSSEVPIKSKYETGIAMADTYIQRVAPAWNTHYLLLKCPCRVRSACYVLSNICEVHERE